MKTAKRLADILINPLFNRTVLPESDRTTFLGRAEEFIEADRAQIKAEVEAKYAPLVEFIEFAFRDGYEKGIWYAQNHDVSFDWSDAVWEAFKAYNKATLSTIKEVV